MDTLFFWASKLGWLLIAPDSLLLILLLAGLLLFAMGKVRTAIKLYVVAVLSLMLVAVFPVGGWLLAPLELRFETNPKLPARVDGIIVLGGAELPVDSEHWKQAELNASAERLMTFLALARRYPEARLVYTGGTGSLLGQQFKEATVAELLFEQQGLDVSRVFFERDSRNTYENALLAYQQVRPRDGENWLLVTTASHMPRSVGVFCQVGWPTIPYPVDHWTVPNGALVISLDLANHLKVLKHAVREWVGLVAYYLTGKTSGLVPEACHAR